MLAQATLPRHAAEKVVIEVAAQSVARLSLRRGFLSVHSLVHEVTMIARLLNESLVPQSNFSTSIFLRGMGSILQMLEQVSCQFLGRLGQVLVRG